MHGLPLARRLLVYNVRQVRAGLRLVVVGIAGLIPVSGATVGPVQVEWLSEDLLVGTSPPAHLVLTKSQRWQLQAHLARTAQPLILADRLDLVRVLTEPLASACLASPHGQLAVTPEQE